MHILFFPLCLHELPTYPKSSEIHLQTKINRCYFRKGSATIWSYLFNPTIFTIVSLMMIFLCFFADIMPRPSRYIFQAGKNTKNVRSLTNRAIICKNPPYGTSVLGWSNLSSTYLLLILFFLSLLLCLLVLDPSFWPRTFAQGP